LTRITSDGAGGCSLLITIEKVPDAGALPAAAADAAVAGVAADDVVAGAAGEAALCGGADADVGLEGEFAVPTARAVGVPVAAAPALVGTVSGGLVALTADPLVAANRLNP